MSLKIMNKTTIRFFVPSTSQNRSVSFPVPKTNPPQLSTVLYFVITMGTLFCPSYSFYEFRGSRRLWNFCRPLLNLSRQTMLLMKFSKLSWRLQDNQIHFSPFCCNLSLLLFHSAYNIHDWYITIKHHPVSSSFCSK